MQLRLAASIELSECRHPDLQKDIDIKSQSGKARSLEEALTNTNIPNTIVRYIGFLHHCILDAPGVRRCLRIELLKLGYSIFKKYFHHLGFSLISMCN